MARSSSRLRWLIFAAVLWVGATGAAFGAGAELIASTEPGWPQFRGPRRDGVNDERGLLPAWPEGGPKLLWSIRGTGRGFSAPVISGGRLVITGDFEAELFVLAYSLEGKPLWRARNGAAWLNQYPGARASATFSGGRVYHENAHGRLACLDAASGREQWAVELLERFRGENITWGLSECLLVDDRAVYATPGGRDGLLVAFDKKSGELLWRSEPLPGERAAIDNAGYGSPILVRFAGRRLVIGCSERALYCADADTGKLQWTRPRPTAYSVIAMMPVLAGAGVFLSAPHGPPGQFHRLVAPARADEPVGVEDGWTAELDSCQGGVVCVADKLIGAYYAPRRGWAALEATTGRVLYEMSAFTKGAALFADGRLYALCEDGWMLLLEPTATEFVVKGKFRLVTARDRDAWAHPVIHDGRLYLRYHDTLYCYDVRAGSLEL